MICLLKKELVPEHVSIKKLENKPKEEENREYKRSKSILSKNKDDERVHFIMKVAFLTSKTS